MKGLITIYLNFKSFDDPDINKMVEHVRVINKELFQKIEQDTKYSICIVPTCNESARIDKIDFESGN